MFRYDRESLKPELLAQLDALKSDARFDECDDMQLERMLAHHTVAEALAHGPEATLARWLDLTILDDLDCGGF